MLVCFLTSARKNHFRISIPDLQQRFDFAPESFRIIDAACDLNIQLFTSLDGNEIYFLLIQYTGIQLITSAQEFNGHDISIIRP